MLKKLLKYEFQATARYFLPMYLLLLLFAVLTRLTFSITLQSNTVLKSFLVDIPSAVMVCAYIAGLVAVGVITLLLAIQRFYKNLLGDEGYLSFTLPVTPMQHVWGKLIPAVVWGVASMAAMLLSLLILVADEGTLPFMGAFFSSLGEALRLQAPHSWLLLLLLILFALSAVLHAYLQIYGAIVLGCQARKYRLLGGIGAYLGFSMVEQILVSIAFTALFLVPDFPMNLLSLFGYSSMSVNAAYFAAELALLGLCLINTVFGAAYYILIWQMLTKHLNLE